MKVHFDIATKVELCDCQSRSYNARIVGSAPNRRLLITCLGCGREESSPEQDLARAIIDQLAESYQVAHSPRQDGKVN
jgi:hypothetical protein